MSMIVFFLILFNDVKQNVVVPVAGLHSHYITIVASSSSIYYILGVVLLKGKEPSSKIQKK
jgi:hypothetical protein